MYSATGSGNKNTTPWEEKRRRELTVACTRKKVVNNLIQLDWVDLKEMDVRGTGNWAILEGFKFFFIPSFSSLIEPANLQPSIATD